MTYQRHVVMFVRAPQLGRVKTRLARGIGALAALQFYRQATTKTLQILKSDSRWHLWLAVTPDNKVNASHWPRRLPRLKQGRGDLGKRMPHIFRSLPPGPAVIVGSDILGLAREHVWEAFQALGNADAVFGPAEDGGYWLIGVGPRFRKGLRLHNVRWSTEYALRDSIHEIGAQRVTLVTQLADMDTPEDWRRFRLGNHTS